MVNCFMPDIILFWIFSKTTWCNDLKIYYVLAIVTVSSATSGRLKIDNMHKDIQASLCHDFYDNHPTAYYMFFC